MRESSARDIVDRTFIVNDTTLKVHELWIVDDDPVIARARCGWRFKTTRHSCVQQLPGAAWFNMRNKCLHLDRVAAKERQCGDVSDSDST